MSVTCDYYASAPYYKLNKGFPLGFLFKPLGGLRPPRGLNKKASEKYPLFITYRVDAYLYLGPSIHGLVTAIQVNVYIGKTLSRLSGEF